MELSDLEKAVLETFEDEATMTLKMVSKKLEKPLSLSKQRVWWVLQLLMAKNMVQKVDRGVYSLANHEKVEV